jgi:hypothetical protein
MPIQIICKVCGKMVSMPPSRKKAKYCSSACYGISQRGRSICSIPQCGRNVLGHGFCNRHYLRLKRHGNPFSFSDRVIRAEQKKHPVCAYCGKPYEFTSYKRKYCSWICAGKSNSKPYIIKNGYKKLLIPSHPRADKKGYVFEHIIIIESALGRSLMPDEVTHHIDGNKLNNAPGNLSTFPNNNEHIKYHSNSK